MPRTPRQVTIQPADPSLGKKKHSSRQNKLKVTYYARVSTNHEEQQLSFEAQRDFYEKKIRSNPEWQLVDGYADYGISGTNTFKRESFNQMIADCKAGKIDLILTKSISRFARNTVDTLTTVRDLQRIGVSVIFEKENINTAKQDCEMLLTIFGSIAQEESRSMSENIKWAMKAKFERGEVMINTNRFMGLDRDKEGEIIEDDEQARVIRLIALLYLSGMSWEEVARDLDRRGIKTVTGKDHWCASTIGSILKNEKYAGIVIQGKSYTVDFLTKRRVKNKGERPRYKVTGAIPAILPMSVFMRIQDEMARRSLKSGHAHGVKHGKYALTELLRCADCGSSFRRVSWRLGGKRIPVYRCKNRILKEGNCTHSPTLKESDIERNILLAINEMKKENGNERVYSIVLNNIKNVLQSKEGNVDLETINEEMKKVKQRIEQLIEQGMNGFEEDPEIDIKIAEEGRVLRQLQNMRNQMLEKQNDQERIRMIEDHLDNNVMNMKQFDNAYMRKMIDHIDVFEDAKIDIHFKCGIVIQKKLESAKV